MQTTRPRQFLSTALLLLGALGLEPDEALGCTPARLPVFELQATVPSANARTAALNAGIVLETARTETFDGGGGLDLFEFALERSDGIAVPGQRIAWHGSSLVWLPDEPLEPNTAYQATFVTGPLGDPALLNNPNLVESHSLQFTTGTELLPPLTLVGDLELSFSVEPQGEGACSCQGPECERSVFADVRLPAVSGGNAAAGYSALLSYAEGAPVELGYASSLPDSAVKNAVSVNVGEAAAAQARIQLNDVPDRASPCVTLSVWDSGGQVVHASTCIDTLDVGALRAENPVGMEGMGGMDVGGADAVATLDAGRANAEAKAPPRMETSDGCAATIARREPSADWTALLPFAILAASRARRTRSRSQNVRLRPM